MEVSGMATIIADLATVLTGLLTNIGSVFTTLLAQDLVMFLILAGVGAGVIFLAIRVLKRVAKAGKRTI